MASQYPPGSNSRHSEDEDGAEGDESQPQVTPRRVDRDGARQTERPKSKPRTVFSDWASI